MAEYIEREALLTRIDLHLVADPRTIGERKFADGYYCALSEAKIMVDQAVTADVELVRHGRWIKQDSMAPEYRCSECGNCYEWFEVGEAHYCPNCGVKMDDEGDCHTACGGSQ